MLVGNQARLVMAEFFAAWLDIYRAAISEEQMKQLTEKQEKSRRKFIMAMSDGQAAQLQEMKLRVFVGWRKHLKELEKEQTNERKTIALLIKVQSRMVLQECAQAWARQSKDKRKKVLHSWKIMKMIIRKEAKEARLVMAEFF